MAKDPSAAPPITPIGILGIALAMLLLAGAAFGLLQAGDRDLEDASSLKRAFSIAALPGNWTQVQVRGLRDGREVYLFEDPSAGEPAALPPDPEPDVKPANKSKSSSGPGAGRGGKRRNSDKKRWLRLVVGRENQPPRRMALVRLPLNRAESELKSLFQGLSYKDLEEVGEDGGDLPMDSGRIDWGSYEAPFVRVRHLYQEDEKPTFHESIRVNLTLGREAWVALFAWDPRLPGNLAWVEQTLGEFQPLSEASRQ